MAGAIGGPAKSSGRAGLKRIGLDGRSIARAARIARLVHGLAFAFWELLKDYQAGHRVSHDNSGRMLKTIRKAPPTGWPPPAPPSPGCRGDVTVPTPAARIGTAAMLV